MKHRTYRRSHGFVRRPFGVADRGLARAAVMEIAMPYSLVCGTAFEPTRSTITDPPPPGGGGAEGDGGGGTHNRGYPSPPPPSGYACHLPLAGEDRRHRVDLPECRLPAPGFCGGAAPSLVGRSSNSPPQLGQRSSSASAHSAQKVHSNEQMNAPGASAGRSAVQRSQMGRISSIRRLPFVRRRRSGRRHARPGRGRRLRPSRGSRVRCPTGG